MRLMTIFELVTKSEKELSALLRDATKAAQATGSSERHKPARQTTDLILKALHNRAPGK